MEESQHRSPPHPSIRRPGGKDAPSCPGGGGGGGDAGCRGELVTVQDIS